MFLTLWHALVLEEPKQLESEWTVKRKKLTMDLGQPLLKDI
jgi:hypothetical protein